MQIKRRVGTNVRAIRDELGLTQMGFAELLGTRPGDVSRWEKGHVVPSLKTLTAIGALVGGRDVAWFYTDHTAESAPAPEAAA